MTLFDTPVPPPSPAVVPHDLPCRKCQYNLRGLSVDGRCPECGTPVGLSTRGDLIRYSDPVWVDTVRRGISMILWAILATTLGVVLGAILRATGNGQLAGQVLTLAAGALSFAGAWLLTTPDPGGVGENRYGTSRKLIRVTAAVGLGQQALTVVNQLGTWSPAANLLFALVLGAAGLVSLVGTFAMLNYLRKLAARVPDQPLADRATTVMYGYGTSLGVLVLIGIAAAVLFRNGVPIGGNNGGMLGVACGFGLAGLAVLVFGVMYLFLLIRFGNALRAQTAIARSTWAARPA